MRTKVYYASFIVLGIAGAVIGPTLPGLAQHVHSTIAQVSYLFVFRSSGYMVGAFFAGRLYDRLRGHPILMTAILSIAVSMLLIPAIQSLGLLGVIFLVFGVVEALLDVGVNTLMMWSHPVNPSPVMNKLHFFFGLGAFLTPIVVAQAVRLTGDIYWAYWVLGIFMIPFGLIFTRIPSPTPVKTQENAPTQTKVSLLVILVGVFLFFYVGSEVAYGGWVFTYATTRQLADASIAAYLTSAFWLAFTSGRLLAVPLGKRLSALKILAIDLLVLLTGMVLIQAFPGSFIALCIGSVAAGLGMASIFPTAFILTGQHINVTGKISSWFLISASMGMIFANWLIGQLFKPVGSQVVILTITGNTLIDLLLLMSIFFYIRKKQTGKENPLNPAGSVTPKLEA